MRVLLPEPVGPMMAVMEPGTAAKLTSLRTGLAAS